MYVLRPHHVTVYYPGSDFLKDYYASGIIQTDPRDQYAWIPKWSEPQATHDRFGRRKDSIPDIKNCTVRFGQAVV